MKFNEKIFRKNDLRGCYKKDFDLDFVDSLAWAFLRFAEKEKVPNPLHIALAHDSRKSSPEIAKQLCSSFADAGAEVYFLGIVPSPACFLASYFFEPKIQASIMITASHNPPADNGFKLMLQKRTLCDQELLEIKTLLSKQKFSKTTKRAGRVRPLDISATYLNYTKSQFPHLRSSQNFAIDCGNGACGPLAKKIFSAFDLKISWMYEKPDGRFPNHSPDPSLEKNLESLQENVTKNNLSFGLAFDGDGDRLVLVGKTGRIFHGDELMALLLSDIFSQSKKKDPLVVADVKCADWFFEFLKEKGARTLIWKSGHSLIRQKTLETKALFGGEFSGHFFFQDKNQFPVDDSIYGSLRLLEILSKKNLSPEKCLPKKAEINTNELRFSTPATKAFANLQKLKHHYGTKKNADCCLIDGLRVRLSNHSWGLARLSNTQDEITLRFGAKTKQELLSLQKSFYQILEIKKESLHKRSQS